MGCIRKWSWHYKFDWLTVNEMLPVDEVITHIFSDANRQPSVTTGSILASLVYLVRYTRLYPTHADWSIILWCFTSKSVGLTNQRWTEFLTDVQRLRM